MSKSPSFRSFKEQSIFFGCHLRFVDQSLLSLYREYGPVEWMRGRHTVDRLPGYDRTLIDSDYCITVKKTDAERKTIYWLCENGFEGWAHERALDGLLFTHSFYFRSAGDAALARLAM